jgi:23S rRNA (guanosine2251-2'-O)-methyltransferase
MGETRILHSREFIIEPGPSTAPTKPNGMAVLLDNIRSAWNVGSILRSADGFGFTHAFLCGITPTADNEAVTKTSLGAEDSVPWSYHKDAVQLVRGLKVEGWKVYGLEEDARAQEIRRASKVTGKDPREILIVGNEVTGVDPELLDLCDQIFYIPMRGEKKSFNVAMAFSVAAYALSQQREER